MPKPPKFNPTKAAEGWRLNVPATMTASGKRERYFFPSREAAKEAAQELRARFQEHGKNAASIRPSLAEDAVKAAALLEPWNATLLDAARAYVAAKERETASKIVSEATAAFLLSCDGLRDRTVDGYRQVCNRINEALGEKLMATLTAEEITKAAGLDKAGAAAANRYRCARAFWNWSAERKWCDADTFKAIQSPRVSKDSEISFLTVEEVSALLRTAEKHYPQAVATYALQFFAGIRVEEVSKLQAEHVTSRGIDLPASVAKKSRRRHITPCETLTAWLAKYPFEPCPNWREVHNACRRITGWDVVSRLLENPPKATRGAWPQNVMRHTFATHAIAKGTPLEEMLFSFGHTGGTALLRSNYVGRSSKKDALEYFSLRPDGKRKKAKFEAVEGVA